MGSVDAGDPPVVTVVTAVGVAAVVLAVLFLPGILISALAGLRGLALLAVAPLVTVGVIAVATVILPMLGVGWNLVSTAASILLVALIAAIVGRRLRRQPDADQRDSRVTPATGLALVLAATIAVIQLAIVFGAPDSISQTFDASFHLNGVKYLLETGNGSSFHLSGLILPEWRSSFYPAGWHDIVALVVMATGVSVPIAANMVNLVVAAFVWPAGVIFFIRSVTGHSTPATIAGGVLSMGFAAFPILPLDFGVLYPYFLGLAMLPAALALALTFTGLVPRTAVHWIPRLLLLAAALAGIALAQTAVVFAWAALLVPAVVVAAIRRSRDAATTIGRVLPLAISGGAIMLLAIAWYAIGRMGNNAPWNAYASVVEGLFELFSNSREGAPVALAVSILVVVGLVSCIRSRDTLWLAGMWAVGALLFFLAATLEFGDLRNIALGLFYKDPPRLAALLAVIAVPVAAVGAHAIWTVVSDQLIPRLMRRKTLSRSATRMVSVAAILVLIVVTQGTAQRHAVDVASTKYAMTDSSPILSTDERFLIEHLDDHVPEDAVVVGNPWTGTSFAYVVGDREVLNPHFNVSTDPLHVAINTGLKDALTDPDVCAAVLATGSEYVLDFGVYSRDSGGVLVFDSTVDYPGLVGLEDSGVVEEVYSVGDKVLYRITACD